MATFAEQFRSKNTANSSFVEKFRGKYGETLTETQKRFDEKRAQEEKKKKNETLKKAQEQAEKYKKEAEYASSFRGMAANFGKAFGETLIKTPINVATSLADIPVRTVQGKVAEAKSLLRGEGIKTASQKSLDAYAQGGIPDYKMPGVGWQMQTYQSKAKKLAENIVDGKASLGSMAWLMTGEVPLAVLETAGLTKGLGLSYKGYKAGLPAKEIAKEVYSAFLPSTRKTTATQEAIEALNKPKITATQKVLEATGMVPKPKVVIPEIAGAKGTTVPAKTASAVENVKSYMGGPVNRLTNETIDTLKKNKLIDDGTFKPDKDGYVTLWREGKVEKGVPNSFSIKQVDKTQIPVKVKVDNILADTTSAKYLDTISETYTDKVARDAYLDALEKYNKSEAEVIAIAGDVKTPKIKTPVVKESAIPTIKTEPEAVPELKAKKISPEVKPSNIARDIKDDFVKKGLMKDIDDGELPGYNASTVEAQNTKITKIINEDFDKFKRILSGEEVDDTLKGGMVIKHAEDIVKNTGDADLAYRIARSPLLGEGSEAASELRFFAERDPDAALTQIKALRKAREEALKMKMGNKGVSVNKATNMAVKEVKDVVKKSAPTKETWGSFIDSIKC